LSGVQGDGAGADGTTEDDDEDFNADAMIDGMMEQLLSKVKLRVATGQFVGFSHYWSRNSHPFAVDICDLKPAGFNVRSYEASCRAIPQVAGRAPEHVVGPRIEKVRSIGWVQNAHSYRLPLINRCIAGDKRSATVSRSLFTPTKYVAESSGKPSSRQRF
jgi:hypothetical protein